MDILQWVRALAALALTLGLIAGAAYAARRFGMIQGQVVGQQRRLKLVERLMLDPRRSLVVVSIDGRDRALLLSPFGDVDLGGLAAAPSDASPTGSAS